MRRNDAHQRGMDIPDGRTPISALDVAKRGGLESLSLKSWLQDDETCADTRRRYGHDRGIEHETHQLRREDA